MSGHPDESVAVSLPSQPDSSSVGTDGQRSNIRTLFQKSRPTVTTSLKKAVLAVPYSLIQIWLPLVAHILITIFQPIRLWGSVDWFTQTLKTALLLVPHMILCLTLTFLLPMSLLRKMIFTREKFPAMWERILLVISCIALAVDPLFLYIPFIDEKTKCIGMDKKLRVVILALRSLTDLPFALHIDAKIHDRIKFMPFYWDEFGSNDIHLRSYRWLSQDIVIEVLPVLPIPQVIIVTTFFRMKGSEYLYKIALCNVFLILQFILRGCQIYRFQKQFKRIDKWIKSAFYFLLYIAAGHVFGAFWYFWSIQREISCWHQTCRNTRDCLAINYCKNTNYSTNITLLDEFCPINPTNATMFNFGLFLQALQSGNTGSTSFSTKFFYTLWWGIKNLSNFGTNLETSNYLWENCFAILISVVGLLLFLYLMGNVQTIILWETTKALEHKQERIESMYKDLDRWMVRNGVLEELKTKAVNLMREKKVAEQNYDADVDLVFVINALDNDSCRALKAQILPNALPPDMDRLYFLDDRLNWRSVAGFDVIKHVEPVVYKENSYVVREGKPNDKMLFITQGVIVGCRDNKRFDKGEVYGEELLTIDRNQGIPKSSQDVKCVTKVEAFALPWTFISRLDYLSRAFLSLPDDPGPLIEAYRKLRTTRSNKLKHQKKKIHKWLTRNNVPENLQTLVMEHIKARNVLVKNMDAEVDVKYMFSIGLPWDIEYRIKKHSCIPSLEKVTVLQRVDEDLLLRICMSLEPLVLLEHSCIFDPHSPIDRMLIVVEGEIIVAKMTGNHGSIVTERGEVQRRITKGDVIGEELLTWAVPAIDSESSNSNPVIMKKYVDCSTKVEAFALTREGLESVIAYYRDGIDNFEQLVNGTDGVADTKGASASCTALDKRLEQLIQLQRNMVQQQGSQGRRLDEMVQQQGSQGRRLDEMVQQQGIIREEMANQGRRLDEMATFLSRLGYPEVISHPPEA